MNTLILIECKDQVGLVNTVTRILVQYEMNIIAMREFVDEAACRFFTRIECSDKAVDEKSLYHELEIHLPENAIIRINPNPEKRLAVLVTKEYHCLGETLVRHIFNTLGAHVCCVIGNHDTLRSFTERFSIPFHFISHENKSKEQFEKELIETLHSYQPDYLVLAKFMRILSPGFVAHYPLRIINIHHSFLPAFIGSRPYRQAYERGVKLIGATAHFVTCNLDEGPIIIQQTIPVNHTLTASDMVIAGREIEKSVLSRAMTMVFEDRVFATGNKTIIFE